MQSVSAALGAEAGWAGSLDLVLGKRGDRTRVLGVEHRGPLRIQRPFYPEEGGTAHLYLLHPPGGVVGGDRLTISIRTEPDSAALVTNPAATKFYRSGGRTAIVEQKLRVGSGAFLEWVPQEVIAFEGALAESKTSIELEEGASFFGWEILCLGRPAAGEGFSRGRISQRLEVWHERQPLYLDRLLVAAEDPTRTAAWGLGGYPVVGTMILAGGPEGLVSLVRESTSSDFAHGLGLGATELEGATVVRYVGPSVRDCWRAFVTIWMTVRPMFCGRPAVAPRIWAC